MSSAELYKVRSYVRALNELAHLATEKHVLRDFLGIVAQQVSSASDVEHVKLLRYRADSNDLLLEAGVGWRSGVVGHVTFPTDMRSAPGRAFQTATPVSVVDFTKETDYTPSPTLVEHGIISLCNVPIMVDGAAWGVLEIDSTVICDFTRDTQCFLVTAASIVAMAVERDAANAAHDRSLEAAAHEAHKNSMLLVEMQHRVKNNFQTILAMLSSMRGRITNDVFVKLSDNIIAMSLAHAQLAPTQTGEAVHLPTYLKALTSRLQKIAENVSVDVHVDEYSVPVERAVPLGLIVNELVTNSIKHAFGKKGGAITIGLRGEVSELHLTVADNGSGMKASKSAGSGLKLVDGLARQLRGHVETLTAEPGTTTRISFPKA